MVPLETYDDFGGDDEVYELPMPATRRHGLWPWRRDWRTVAAAVGAALLLLALGAAIGAVATFLALRKPAESPSSLSASDGPATSAASASDGSSLPAAASDGAAPNASVILLIGDGCGLQATSLARLYALRKSPAALADPLGALTDAGRRGRWALSQVTTRSSSHWRTDSAASGTALACGRKTYNGAIGVTPDGRACRTLVEAACAAENAGRRCGAVATGAATGATIAAFTAHVASRSLEEAIAAQQVALAGLDVIIAGGRSRFASRTRSDGRDLLAEAASAGFSVVTDPTALAHAVDQRPARLLALLAEDSFPFAIDREAAASPLPRLASLLRAAVDVLEPDPYFLLVEGANIDVAEHRNDAAATAHDAVEFFEAVSAATEIAEEDGNTVVLVVADHDTGGLSLGAGYSGYNLDFGPVLNANASILTMATMLAAGDDAGEVLLRYGGIGTAPTTAELAEIASAGTSLTALQAALSTILSARAGVAWGTQSHAATDVVLYTFVPEQLSARGFPSPALDNTEIPHWIASAVGLDLDPSNDAFKSIPDPKAAAPRQSAAVPNEATDLQQKEGTPHWNH